MRTVRTVAELRAAVGGWRSAGERVALTPTMGALHEGHLSLVALGRARAERIVATIFVNPTQFGPGEDLAAYPREEARDAVMLEGAGCDLLFAPSPGEMYPEGFATKVRVTGLTEMLCGAERPGHFDGVAQVVTKYLNQAQADVAIFGEKDWQQLAIIRQLARDLDIPTEIVGAPVMREKDGLAMSSRNRYLGREERRIAGQLNRVLREAAAGVLAGGDPRAAEAAGREALIGAGFASVDYVEIRDGGTLQPAGNAPGARIFGAARIGRARLIDNMALDPGDRGARG